MNPPREPSSWCDISWGLVAAVSAVWFLQAITDAGLLGGVLLLAPAFFIVVGAWRRTIWGCPFAHHPGTDEDDVCPRHPVQDHATEDNAAV